MTRKKYPQFNHTPKNIFIFLKIQKNIKIKTFEPPKNGLSPRKYENIRVPHPTPALGIKLFGIKEC